MLALLLLSGTSLLRQTFAVCLLHELGHGAAMAAAGAGIREIRLYAAGVQMRTSKALVSVRQELCILLSGPAANLLAAAILFRLQGGGTMAMLHLGMGLFNLLPYRILDGGSALRCLLAVHPSALRILSTCNILLAAVLAILGMYWRIGNPALYAMLVYLAVMELQVDKKDGLW